MHLVHKLCIPVSAAPSDMEFPQSVQHSLSSLLRSHCTCVDLLWLAGGAGLLIVVGVLYALLVYKYGSSLSVVAVWLLKLRLDLCGRNSLLSGYAAMLLSNHCTKKFAVGSVIETSWFLYQRALPCSYLGTSPIFMTSHLFFVQQLLRLPELYSPWA